MVLFVRLVKTEKDSVPSPQCGGKVAESFVVSGLSVPDAVVGTVHVATNYGVGACSERAAAACVVVRVLVYGC